MHATEGVQSGNKIPSSHVFELCSNVYPIPIFPKSIPSAFNPISKLQLQADPKVFPLKTISRVKTFKTYNTLLIFYQDFRDIFMSYEDGKEPEHIQFLRYYK